MVALVIECGKIVGPQKSLCPSEHVPHGLVIVVPGHLVIDGDIVFRVDRGLYVVGYLGDVVAHDHLAALWIRCGDLFLSRFLQPAFQVLVLFLSFAVFFDFFLNIVFISIFFFELPLVFYQFFVDIGDMAVYLLLVVVVLLAVLGAQLGAVARDHDCPDQAEIACYPYCGPEDLFDGLWIVHAEIADGFVVGCKALDQPHRLDVAPALLFELPA